MLPSIPQWFIDELSKLAGNNPFGKPILKIVDGTTERKWADGPIKYVGRKQRVKKLTISNGVWAERWTVIQHGIERYVIEEWWPPTLLRDHELKRYGKHPQTGEKIDLLGPYPSEGKWRALLTLQDNDGNFMLPDDRVMSFLRLSYTIHQEFKLHGDDEAANEREIAAEVAARLAREDKMINDWGEKIEDLVGDAFAGHEHRLLLSNPTEGLHAHHRRGATYDPNWDQRLKADNKQNKQNNQENLIHVVNS